MLEVFKVCCLTRMVSSIDSVSNPSGSFGNSAMETVDSSMSISSPVSTFKKWWWYDKFVSNIMTSFTTLTFLSNPALWKWWRQLYTVARAIFWPNFLTLRCKLSALTWVWLGPNNKQPTKIRCLVGRNPALLSKAMVFFLFKIVPTCWF